MNPFHRLPGDCAGAACAVFERIAHPGHVAFVPLAHRPAFYCMEAV